MRTTLLLGKPVVAGPVERKDFVVSELENVSKEVELKLAVKEREEEGEEEMRREGEVEVEDDVTPEVEREEELIVGRNVDMLETRFVLLPDDEARNVVRASEVGNNGNVVGKTGANELGDPVLIGMLEVVK